VVDRQGVLRAYAFGARSDAALARSVDPLL
jgi:hypothetical protein